MTDYNVTYIHVGNNSMWSDIECVSMKDFLAMPTLLMIDDHVFTKTSYHLQNKTAYYKRKVLVKTFNAKIAGKFIIIDNERRNIADTDILRSEITVNNKGKIIKEITNEI